MTSTKTAIYLNLFEYNKLKMSEKKNYIQACIDKCAALGGGLVGIPEGTWVSGPLHLKSGIELHLCANSIISFSSEPDDYLPVVFTRWEGIECYNYSPLIYGRDCKNISITGTGKLLGNGKNWWHWKALQKNAAEELVNAQRNGITVEQRIYGTTQAALRPSFIQFINCKNITLKDFIIEDGPQWTIHPVYCENMMVDGVKVFTYGPNTDGLNPDSCTDVTIKNSTFETGDDCIAINSGMNEDGWRVNKPCKNITIENCTMTGGHGAIVIGSGMSGGIEDIKASKCQISGTLQGLRIKSMRGRGGYIKNVLFENINISSVEEEAIQVSMFYPYSTVEPQNPIPPVFENITIRNVCGTSKKYAKVIRGLEDSPIRGLTLENIDIKATKDDIVENAE